MRDEQAVMQSVHQMGNRHSGLGNTAHPGVAVQPRQSPLLAKNSNNANAKAHEAPRAGPWVTVFTILPDLPALPSNKLGRDSGQYPVGLGGTAEPDRPHSLLNLSLRVCVPVRACAVYHTALRHLNAHAHQALLAVLSWSALEVSPVESLRVLPFLLCLVWFAH